ncbi:hypothetical protein SPACI_036310 [Sporomusa acidovorans DSM 3132]|uniref:Uncharacterized protein n=1 Tax=Sporomusa acidovorans (strain ATCC 49682 / DSM 3132 / Mol) TaxID=1123286 RepID=A0ABZ3J575_SPOA4|nr:hypothetical protein SPACI_47490 [Sporomusa acidovorans DSM 3132]SDE88675.1 hypothetical protein SAMN04488499_102547 [Sporomusa acidovorans]
MKTFRALLVREVFFFTISYNRNYKFCAVLKPYKTKGVGYKARRGQPSYNAPPLALNLRLCITFRSNKGLRLFKTPRLGWGIFIEWGKQPDCSKDETLQERLCCLD